MTCRTGTAVVAVLCVLALTSCGKDADDLFSNLNGTSSSNASEHETPSSGRAGLDAPPFYGDNSRARRPDRPDPADEKRAREKVKDITQALEDLRRQHRTRPAQVREALAPLTAPARLEVTERTTSGDQSPVRGSVYGIWIGRTACVTGAVTAERVWSDVNGHFPETGCLPPAPAH
ncbi:hypothetical protein OOK39_17660 [Streptomyces sp. NBC_00264]|uniref:hypothetical protein n=1 Tax=unclassified Streptomyces TaxID=2593676 RepID=UPI0022567E82|nr:MULTISPECIES: hypothetical protein [unclassified Streptomyces]MCX5161091.1 hypothetical protein [Streptomyces sp. NBC_00305]MCX5219614.1 hypothetical protein [Streptomyces sp. NBC_00264]